MNAPAPRPIDLDAHALVAQIRDLARDAGFQRMGISGIELGEAGQLGCVLALVAAEHRHHHAGGAGAPGATRAVDVVLVVGGQVEVDHAGDALDVDPASGDMTMVTDEVSKPNGLCFSPDYKKLYVTDTGAEAPLPILSWDVVDGQTLRNRRRFAAMEYDGKTGGADGIRSDTDGNIWASAGWGGEGFDGVHIFAPNGDRIGVILLPEICSNLCFGGMKRNRLFMTASQSLYSLYVEARGAHFC